jgi:Mg-chelatase subunit ChlD
LPQSAMRDLAHWVKHLGGGLLMTGGYNSYGVGGYYRSQLEDVLPVTMEIREEQRKFGLAMVIALDRSGSMRAAAGDTTKMQLANRGAATAVDLLSGMDAVSVLAVDTGPHIVQPLTAVDDRKDEILARVRSIESSGGGIYIGAALHAAAEQLAEADQENRHIVVFADASDAEEPDDYRTFLPELVAQGITVSTIGLGSEHGTDAGLLKEIATLGQGRCQFVADASELPRVFAQETIQVARSSLVEEPSDVVVEPSLSLLGAMPDETPPIAGYTVAWMRERAELDLRAERRSGAGEGPEPLLAHWQIGLGRTAAFLGEADGVLSGEWGEWPRYADFFGTLVRWLSGNAPAGLFVDVRRDGDVAVYELEVAADQASVLDQLHGVITEPDGSTVAMVFDSIANGRVQVRVPLVREGVHRAAVQLGGDTVRLPPVCLPYSAEWQLQPDPLRGEQILRSLAAQTAGNVEPSVAAALAGPRRSLGQMDVAPFLMWITLALLLLEIALRRLQVQLPNYASKWLLSRANKRSQPRVRNAKPHAATPSRGKQLDGMDAGKDPGSDRAAPDSSQAIESPQAGESPQDNLLSALERAQKRGGRRF